MISKSPPVLLFTDLDSIKKLDQEKRNSQKDFEDAFEIVLDIFDTRQKNENDPKKLIKEIKEICDNDEPSLSDFDQIYQLISKNLPEEEIDMPDRKEILQKFWSAFEKPQKPHDIKEIGEFIFKSCIEITSK